SNSLLPKLGKGFSKEMFISQLKKDYSLFSGVFHPKQDSFMNNLWVSDTDEKGNWTNTRSYGEKKDKENVTIFLFPKKTPFHPEYLKRMIHVFYVYNELSLGELRKLENGID